MSRKKEGEPAAIGKGQKPGKAGVEYSVELGDQICAKLREGLTLNAICNGPDMPHESSVREWAANPDHPFAPKYTRAREIGYQKWADDMVAISDGNSVSWLAGDEKAESSKDDVHRDRLRIETRKWLLSKALPKIYGDKLTLDGDLKVTMPEDQLDSRLGALLAKAATKPNADTVH